MNKLSFNFKLPVSIIKEGKKYVAYSPALDLSTSGNSYESVKKRFEEIVDIFFEELVENNTVEDVLYNLGWKRVQSKWSPPMIISQELQTVSVMAR